MGFTWFLQRFGQGAEPLLLHYERFKNVEPITERLCKYTTFLKKHREKWRARSNQVTGCVFAKIVSTLESFVIIVQDNSNLIEVILRIWYTTVFNSIKFRGVCFKDINVLHGSQNCQLVMRKE